MVRKLAIIAVIGCSCLVGCTRNTNSVDNQDIQSKLDYIAKLENKKPSDEFIDTLIDIGSKILVDNSIEIVSSDIVSDEIIDKIDSVIKTDDTIAEIEQSGENDHGVEDGEFDVNIEDLDLGIHTISEEEIESTLEEMKELDVFSLVDYSFYENSAILRYVNAYTDSLVYIEVDGNSITGIQDINVRELRGGY